MNDREAELSAITTRAGIEEAARLAAVQRQDWQAAKEHEVELSRLHARFRDLQGDERAA